MLRAGENETWPVDGILSNDAEAWPLCDSSSVLSVNSVVNTFVLAMFYLLEDNGPHRRSRG